MSTLSIIIPAYNEEATLEQIVEKVENTVLDNSFEKEIIIVNDCSKDNTLQISEKLAQKYPNIKVLSNEQNLGKSQTVKKGILASTGDYLVIQYADLEYEPKDFAQMLKLAVEKGYSVIYGDRFGKHNQVIYWQNYIGNRGLTFFSNLFTIWRLKDWVHDMETCYKLFKGDLIRDLGHRIESRTNFGFEPEITALISRYAKKYDIKFTNYPISYYPRTIEQGKKIRVSDGFKALKEIIYFNLFA